MIDQDTVLALLEDGPKSAEQLAEWLQVTRIQAARALRIMADDGLVKVTGVEKRWALASYVAQVGRRKATIPRLVSEKSGPAVVRSAAQPQVGPAWDPRLRQLPVKAATADQGSFWVGKSRDELREAIAQNQRRMHDSRMASRVDPGARELS